MTWLKDHAGRLLAFLSALFAAGMILSSRRQTKAAGDAASELKAADGVDAKEKAAENVSAQTLSADDAKITDLTKQQASLPPAPVRDQTDTDAALVSEGLLK